MIRELDLTSPAERATVLALVTDSQHVQHVDIDGRDTPEQSAQNARQSWEANILDPAAHYFVFADKTLKGYISLREVGDSTGVIDDLGVDRLYQRQGIGGKLVEYVIDRATTMGLSKLKLITQTENLAAVTTYRSAGFEETVSNYIDFEKKL